MLLFNSEPSYSMLLIRLQFPLIVTEHRRPRSAGPMETRAMNGRSAPLGAVCTERWHV